MATMGLTGATIEIPVSEYVEQNEGLIRLLRILRKVGVRGMTTKELCFDHMHSASHTYELLDIAQKKGYVRRVKVRRHSRRGGMSVTNYITDKGIELLNKL